MHRLFILFLVCLLLASCRGEDDTPLPTRILDLTPTIEGAISPTPGEALPPTWTPVPTITITPTPTFTPSATPTETPTLNLIQQTEVYLFGLRTAEAATAAAMAPTLPPTPEGGEAESGLLPEINWQAYEVTLTMADLTRMVQQIGMNNAAVSLQGIFVWITWRSGSDENLLVIRQDALDGTLILTPISYQQNGAVADLAEAADLIEQLRGVILSLRRPERVSYLDAVLFGTDAFTLRFLQSPE